MMASTVDFVNGCKEDQLLEIDDHYDIAVAGKCRKDKIKRRVLMSLFECGVLNKTETESVPMSVSVATGCRQQV